MAVLDLVCERHAGRVREQRHAVRVRLVKCFLRTASDLTPRRRFAASGLNTHYSAPIPTRLTCTDPPGDSRTARGRGATLSFRGVSLTRGLTGHTNDRASRPERQMTNDSFVRPRARPRWPLDSGQASLTAERLRLLTSAVAKQEVIDVQRYAKDTRLNLDRADPTLTETLGF